MYSDFARRAEGCLGTIFDHRAPLDKDFMWFIGYQLLFARVCNKEFAVRKGYHTAPKRRSWLDLAGRDSRNNHEVYRPISSVLAYC